MTHPLQNFDPAQETERITSFLREACFVHLRRKGAILGLSGGVDSAVCAALCKRAFGTSVLAISMPEKECKEATRKLPARVAEHFEIEWIEEDITPMLDAYGAYERRNDALRISAPDFKDHQKFKISPNPVQDQGVRFFTATIEGAEQSSYRLDSRSYLGIVAASNFKQRCRKTVEYYYAERRHYCVIGTPNLQEYELGFFVKQGDGAADVKPIAHLYKCQVYALANHLGVPEEIIKRAPTTDTYPLEQEQDEFFFSLNFEQMDVCLWGLNQGLSPSDCGRVIGLSAAQVERIYTDIASKRKNAAYLHAAPLRLQPNETNAASAASGIAPRVDTLA